MLSKWEVHDVVITYGVSRFFHGLARCTFHSRLLMLDLKLGLFPPKFQRSYFKQHAHCLLIAYFHSISRSFHSAPLSVKVFAQKSIFSLHLPHGDEQKTMHHHAYWQYISIRRATQGLRGVTYITFLKWNFYLWTSSSIVRFSELCAFCVAPSPPSTADVTPVWPLIKLRRSFFVNIHLTVKAEPGSACLLCYVLS